MHFYSGWKYRCKFRANNLKIKYIGLVCNALVCFSGIRMRKKHIVETALLDIYSYIILPIDPYTAKTFSIHILHRRIIFIQEYWHNCKFIKAHVQYAHITDRYFWAFYVWLCLPLLCTIESNLIFVQLVRQVYLCRIHFLFVYLHFCAKIFYVALFCTPFEWINRTWNSHKIAISLCLYASLIKIQTACTQWAGIGGGGWGWDKR